MAGGSSAGRDAPWFKLWVADWLSGESTSLMKPEQEGAFLRLLMHSWLNTPPCTLPGDDAALATLSRLGRRWKKLGPSVRRQFEDVGDGRIRNRKLFQVFEEMTTQRELLSAAGRKGAAAKWKRRTDADRLPIGEEEP